MLGVCLSSFLSLTAMTTYGSPYPVKINPCTISYMTPRTDKTGCSVILTNGKIVDVSQSCDKLNDLLIQIVRP